MTNVKKMAHGLTEKQGTELCETIGKMLVLELESEVVKAKVKKMITEYVKKNKINANPAVLSDKAEWRVQVRLKK
jgi:hypothetical protein